MNITDELREWAEAAKVEDIVLTTYPAKHAVHGIYEQLLAIADRIDEAHKHAIGYVDDRDPETMAENGWVRLPKDGNGEYVHVGDVMAYADNTNPMQVVALVPPSVFMVEDGPRFADMCRHYHAPTVEDVLYEMCDRLDDPSGDDLSKTIEDFVAEYAAKLQLRED
jgi:hypothetical protein